MAPRNTSTAARDSSTNPPIFSLLVCVKQLALSSYSYTSPGAQELLALLPNRKIGQRGTAQRRLGRTGGSPPPPPKSNNDRRVATFFEKLLVGSFNNEGREKNCRGTLTTIVVGSFNTDQDDNKKNGYEVNHITE